MIVLVFTGFQFGELVNTLAPQIPRGILGAIVIFLVYRNILFPIKRESIEALFLFPTNIKYFLYSFFGSVIIYWGVTTNVFYANNERIVRKIFFNSTTSIKSIIILVLYYA